MPTNAKEAELRERILNLRLPTTVERVLFFPDYALEQVLTKDVVAEVIEASGIPIHDRINAADDIIGGAQKIFCILVCIRKVDCMHLFLQSGIGDAKLAVSKEDLIGSGLTNPAAEEFWEQQWEFIAPIFKSRVQKLNLSCILPFKEEQSLGEGGYGTVSRVVLYRSHQGLVFGGSGDTVAVARKTIKCVSAGTEGYFESERGPLELLRTRGHPHIIKLLGSYSQNNAYNFFFPLADGSLKDLFDRGRQGFEMDDDRFYSSIVGLSSAINHIHNFTYESGGRNMNFKGYHHDLKPANILIHQGKFIIADFGLSKLKADANTTSTVHKTGSRAYLPPEAMSSDPEANFDDPIVGRGVDIWAFGCILAEIATFLLKGSESVSEFGRRRFSNVSVTMNDDSFHAFNEVKKEVKEWLKSLEIMAKGNCEISLLIQIVRKALIPNRKERPTAEDVLKEVSRLDTVAATNMELFALQDRKALPPSPPRSPAGSSQSRPQTTSRGGETSRDNHGIIVLSEGTRDPELQMDVVALHGLNGGSYTCWQGGEGSMWLKDLLPDDGMHLPRIISYGYDSEYLFTNLSRENLEKEAYNFLRCLRRKREDASTRPIIFLAHSVGGFLLKQAILLAEEDAQFQDLFKSICGVTFFGTPHREHGILYTMGAVLRKIARTASVLEQNRELLSRKMGENDRLLKAVNNLFKTRICIPESDLRVLNFYETGTISGLGVVVDEGAGTMGLNGEETCGLKLSHPDLCKYSSESEPSYKIVKRKILRLTKISADEYSSKQAKKQKQETPYINNHQQFNPEIYVNNNIMPQSPIIPPLQRRPTAPQSTQPYGMPPAHFNMTPPHQSTMTPTPPPRPPAPRTHTSPPPPPPPAPRPPPSPPPAPPPSHTQPKKKQPPPPSQLQNRAHTAPTQQQQKKSQAQNRNSINAIEERLAKVGRNITSIGADLAARQKERKALKPRRQERGEQWFSEQTRRLDKIIAELEVRRTEAYRDRERLKLELIGARAVHGQ
ncbi:kinase-like protein [Choiromyces venosus 120613-1]|uniref:Kinase-like protein n=1 Tax=Choiromyces venosus 120613-1 TaxID=1336337 RepID=A0A3N4K5A5_9PEZI|nr:kinase-like protein [Choiromyces venosus 120613-1]